MPHVYLVQPVELVGTHRYKIGMSSLANLNRVRSYKNGSRYLCILEKSDALGVERRLKRAFNKRYTLIGGNEYFEIKSDTDTEEEMIDLFIATAMGYSIVRNHTDEEDTTECETDGESTEQSSGTESESEVEQQSSDNVTTMLSASWLKKYEFARTASRSKLF